MMLLYQAHSGLRYLVLLVGLVTLAVALYTVFTRQPVGAARGLGAAFTGVLDVQVLLGIALAVSGIFYGALMGHIAMMVLAAAVSHVCAVLARKSADARKASLLRLAGVLVPLLLIVLGITAIGRSVFGSMAPTPVG